MRRRISERRIGAPRALCLFVWGWVSGGDGMGEAVIGPPRARARVCVCQAQTTRGRPASFFHPPTRTDLAHEEEVALGDGAVRLQEVRLEVHVEQVACHALCVCVEGLVCIWLMAGCLLFC